MYPVIFTNMDKVINHIKDNNLYDAQNAYYSIPAILRTWDPLISYYEKLPIQLIISNHTINGVADTSIIEWLIFEKCPMSPQLLTWASIVLSREGILLVLSTHNINKMEKVFYKYIGRSSIDMIKYMIDHNAHIISNDMPMLGLPKCLNYIRDYHEVKKLSDYDITKQITREGNDDYINRVMSGCNGAAMYNDKETLFKLLQYHGLTDMEYEPAKHMEYISKYYNDIAQIAILYNQQEILKYVLNKFYIITEDRAIKENVVALMVFAIKHNNVDALKYITTKYSSINNDDPTIFTRMLTCAFRSNNLRITKCLIIAKKYDSNLPNIVLSTANIINGIPNDAIIWALEELQMNYMLANAYIARGDISVMCNVNKLHNHIDHNLIQYYIIKSGHVHLICWYHNIYSVGKTLFKCMTIAIASTDSMEMVIWLHNRHAELVHHKPRSPHPVIKRWMDDNRERHRAQPLGMR